MQNLYKHDQIVFMILRFIIASNHHYFTPHAFKSTTKQLLVINAAKFRYILASNCRSFTPHVFKASQSSDWGSMRPNFAKLYAMLLFSLVQEECCWVELLT